MYRSIMVCGLGLLGAAPASAADYLNGDWFILTGANGIASSDQSGELAKVLAKEKGVKAVGFTSSGGLAYVFGGNGIIFSDVPDSLGAKVPDLWKLTGDFRCVAFRPQGGWIILHDKNGFAQDGMPEALVTQLKKIQKAEGTLRSVAFTPDGGWLLLLEKEFIEEGLPKELKDRLTELYKNKIAVRCVAFDSQGDWFLVDDRNDCFSSHTEHPAYKRLTELKAKGQVLQWIAFSPGEYTHGYVLEHYPVERIKAVMTTKFTRPEGGVTEWIVVPPQAPELPRQRDIKLTLEPEGITVADTGALKQTFRMSRVTDKPKGFTAKATYEMTLYTNRLVPRLASQPVGKAELPPELHSVFTHITDDIKSKVFQEFLDKSGLRRKPKETDMALARRTFLYISKHFTYLYPNPDKQDVVEVGKGDCGGLSWVFIRTMRANGIPARLLLGRWAGSEVPAKGNQPADGLYHAKPEVFIHGVGWVGTDMSGGVGVESNPFVCFGTEAGDFVVLDLDIDRIVPLKPKDKPTHVGGSQGFMWWWFTDKDGKEPRLEDHWTLEVLDKHPVPTAVKPSWKRPPPSGPHKSLKNGGEMNPMPKP
jgi:transglutaminase-like putative cysteine protease